MSEAGEQTEQPPASWAEIFSGRYGAYTLVLNLGTGLFAINQFVVTTIMPTVVADLGGVDYYAWAFSLFAVGSIIGAASAGPLREAFGAKRAYVGSGLLMAFGLAGAALATDMPTLVAWRLVQGIGGGAVASQAYGLVAVIFPQNLRSRVLGLISTVWGIATVAGPGFGGIFASPELWRWAFLSLVPVAAVFALLAWRYIPGEKGHGRLSVIPYWRLAYLGAAVFGVSATSLAEANWLRAILIVLALAAAAMAFARDAAAERPMFPRQVTAMMTELGATYWIIFLVSIVLTFVNTFTTLYLQVLHGIPPLTAGYLFAIQSFMWTASALVAAGLSQNREVPAIVIGLVLMLVAAIAIAATVTSGPVLAISIAIGISGAGIGLMNNPAIQRIIAVAPEAEKHVAGTSVQTVRNIGVSFGAAVSGMVAATAGLTEDASVESVAHAMQWVYGVNVGVAALALLMVIPLLAARRAAKSA